MSGAVIEQRAVAEFRAAGRRLVGYAAVFNSPAQLASFTETVRPGAFSATLTSGREIRALVDHSPSKLLGRTSSGTLRLSADQRGLAFELDLPDTQIGRDILTMVERRDVSGVSMGFVTPKGGDAWPAANRRELVQVDLHEISALHSEPAYRETSVEARERQQATEAFLARQRFLEYFR